MDDQAADRPFDRYRELGLSGNPFATPPVALDPGQDPLRQPPAHDQRRYVDRGLPDPPPPGQATMVQVIGERGAGKSTQLARWRSDAPGPYHYVPPPWRDRWARPPLGNLVYGDEIDRLPRLLLRRWLARLAAAGSTVVIGSHTDLTRAGRRAELTVVTHWLGPVDRATLGAMIERRIEAVRLPDVPATPTAALISGAEIDEVLSRCGGSIRDAEVRLHQLLAARAELGTLSDRQRDGAPPAARPAARAPWRRRTPYWPDGRRCW